jgi:hypothetical protein
MPKDAKSALTRQKNGLAEIFESAVYQKNSKSFGNPLKNSIFAEKLKREAGKTASFFIL